MGKWKEIVFSEICDFENGDRGKNYPSRTAYIEEGIPFFSAGNIVDNKIDESSLNFISKERFDLLGSGKVRKGDILFCLRGSLGKFAEIESEIEGGIASSLVIIRPSNKINLGFLKLFLESHLCSEMIKKYDNGTAQPNLSASSLKKFKIPLPPLPEQQRIVAKLDALFAKLDKAIRLLEANLQHTQALMGSVLDEEFGKLEKSDFEPFLNAVFIQNKTLVPNDNAIYNYVGLENIESNTGKLVDFSETLGELIKSSKVHFEKEDVLYGKLRPYLNKVWVSSFKGVATTEILPFKAKQEKILPKYLAYYLRSNNFLNVVNANTSGARMPRASARFFKDIAQVPKVNLVHQQKTILKFDKLFNHFESLIEAQTQKLNHLKALKSSLLDQAFKGDL